MNEKQYYRAYSTLIKKHERLSYQIVLRGFKAIYAKAAKEYLNNPSIPVDLLISETDTLDILVSIYNSVGMAAASMVFNSLTKQKQSNLILQTKAKKPTQYKPTPEPPLDHINYWKQEFLRFTQSKDCAKKVAGVTRTTKEQIRKVIEQSVNEQLSHKQTAKLILEKADAIDTKKRALLIARTENAVGSNMGAMYAAKSSGLILYKKWIARSGDNRTRDFHVGMIDSKPIPINDLFLVGSEKMSCPGDSSHGAKAHNICNCRCTVAFIPASEVVQQSLNNPVKKPIVPKPIKQPDLFEKPIVIEDLNVFKPAATVKEAIEFAQTNIASNVDLYWVKDVDIANRINRVAFELKNEYGLDMLKHFATRIRGKGEMAANFNTLNIRHTSFNSQRVIADKFISNAEKRKLMEEKIDVLRKHYADTNNLASLSIIRKYEQKLRFKNGWTVEYGVEKHTENVLNHEYGHIIHDQILGGLNKIKVISQARVNTPLYLDRAIQLQDEHLANFKRARLKGDIYNISEYGSSNQAEFFAESFVMYRNADINLPIYMKEFFDKLKILSKI